MFWWGQVFGPSSPPYFLTNQGRHFSRFLPTNIEFSWSSLDKQESTAGRWLPYFLGKKILANQKYSVKRKKLK
jgi:hypothetical protein